MLHRIVESAAELVGARYGALGVLDEAGIVLAQFLTVGVDDDTHHAFGHLPEGHGILGVLIADPRPLRLPDLSAHPDSYRFPPHHPTMRAFLDVPVKLRDQVFGNLYLTDKIRDESRTRGAVDAAEFGELDEELAVGLASAAAVAIDNARLHVTVQSLALVDDRERIARDLHDVVIQRLFATGLSLQGTVRLVRDDAGLWNGSNRPLTISTSRSSTSGRPSSGCRRQPTAVTAFATGCDRWCRSRPRCWGSNHGSSSTVPSTGWCPNRSRRTSWRRSGRP